MGIPFYFRNVVNKYQGHVVRPLNNSKLTGGQTTVERFFLDFNCILHQSAAQVTSLKAYPASNGYAQMYQDVIENALVYTTRLIHMIRPSKTVYIAVDGPCPRAKMHQQRKRRFMSVWRARQLQANYGRISTHTPTPTHTHTPNLAWDSNTITPGTSFMDMLNDRLGSFCDDMTRNLGGGVSVIASDSDEFGEGEHKIYQYMHANALATKDAIDVIYGLDADLIMLSLLEPTPVFLLREAPEFNGVVSTPTHQRNQPHPFLTLDIESLKAYIYREMIGNHCATDPRETQSQCQKLVDDYVFICALLGNDFLPPLSCLKIKSNGIELLMQAYRKRCYELSTTIVLDRNELNLPALKNILEYIAAMEDTLMLEANDQYYNARARTHNPQNKESAIDSYPVVNKYPQVIDPSKPGWRLQWYHHLFHNASPDLISKVCTKYLEGLMWVLSYYFTSDQSNAWYYPYVYSPTVMDLHTHLANELMLAPHQQKQSTAKNTSPDHHRFMSRMIPEMQLLMVLPPQSACLIKNPVLQPLLTSPDLGAVHYYPHNFAISTYLKTYLWECSAILPDIDFDHLLACHDVAATVVGVQSK